MPRTADQGQDAIQLLTEDHKRVQQMFKTFEQLKESEDEEQKAAIVALTCAALTIHAQIEEEIFYPAARDALDEQDILDEAEVEHASAKDLIAQLADMQPGDELYDAKFKVLGEYVNHHIKEEQDELFRQVKKADLDLKTLGTQLMERQQELMAEMGIEGPDQDDDPEQAAEGRQEMGEAQPAQQRPSARRAGEPARKR
jgi:hypothetical protein